MVEGGLYGPGFIARVVVQKILDCIPLYRQCKAFAREGLHVGRSTLVDLFHLAASLIEPLYLHMLEQVPDSRVVYADETSLKMQRVKKLGYIWTFATTLYVTYVFSPSRSGKTPEEVLGDSAGVRPRSSQNTAGGWSTSKRTSVSQLLPLGANLTWSVCPQAHAKRAKVSMVTL